MVLQDMDRDLVHSVGLHQPGHCQFRLSPALPRAIICQLDLILMINRHIGFMQHNMGYYVCLDVCNTNIQT